MDVNRISEMTVDEFLARLRVEIDSIVRQAVRDEMLAVRTRAGDPTVILAIPPLSLPADHPALRVVSRDEMYGDDGR